MTQPMQQLDVREKRGTFLILTYSGASYTIRAEKSISGKVMVSGGSLNLSEQPAILKDPLIHKGSAMQLSWEGKTVANTSMVDEIYPINGLSQAEITAITQDFIRRISA